ncbi:MAG: SDR family oxidoreductase [Rhodanobacter sp.]
MKADEQSGRARDRGPHTGRLSGHRVAVVGGTRGIGLAIAECAQAHEAIVTIGGRDAKRRREALAALNDKNVAALQLDATDDESVDSFFATTGPVDHLVVSIAGEEGQPVPFLETDTDRLREHFDRTFWASFRSVKAFARQAPRTATSSIVLISGGLSRRPMVGKSAYTMSQWAIEGLARSLVGEVAPVRVNVLVPGLVESPRWDFLPPAERSAFFEIAAASLPTGFIAGTSAIATAAVELMANRYISGSTLVVDGGWTAVS